MVKSIRLNKYADFHLNSLKSIDTNKTSAMVRHGYLKFAYDYIKVNEPDYYSIQSMIDDSRINIPEDYENKYPDVEKLSEKDLVLFQSICRYIRKEYDNQTPLNMVLEYCIILTLMHKMTSIANSSIDYSCISYKGSDGLQSNNMLNLDNLITGDLTKADRVAIQQCKSKIANKLTNAANQKKVDRNLYKLSVAFDFISEYLEKVNI